MTSKQFQQLVNDYTADLLRWALQRLSDKEVAKDLVQDTFVAAWEQREKFEGRSHPKTWLIGILKNKTFDHLRQRYKENATTFSVHPFFEGDGNWKRPERPQSWPEEAEATWLDQPGFRSVWDVCLGKLSDVWRSAVSAKYLDEKDSAAICQEMGISQTNYWQMLHRAKLQLRKCLEVNWVNQ